MTSVESTSIPSGSPTDDHTPRETKWSRLFNDWAWLLCAAISFTGLIITWKVVAHTREAQTLPQFIFKMFIFFFTISAVALFPRMKRAAYLLATIPLYLVLGYVMPRMGYFYLQGNGSQFFNQYYTYEWTMWYPLFLLAICFAWRQAGGSRGRTIKIGLTGLILVFSGFHELLWFLVNSNKNYYAMKTIPHIDVIIGHFPSWTELWIYTLLNIPLLVIIYLLPFDRWLTRLTGTSDAEAVTEANAA